MRVVCDRGSTARRRRSHLYALSCNAAASSLMLLCCSNGTPPGDGDAATSADAGAETSGTTGGSAGRDGASGSGGAAGSGGAGGSAATGGAGSGGTTGGRGGSEDGGGAAGSSRDGQAGTSGGAGDAARDGADGSSDASFGSDGDADARAEAAADSTDARADITAPPLDVDAMPPSDGSACTPLPSAGVYATFRVVNDVFYASITNPAGIDQALALWRGQSQAKIPVGQLECGNGTYNCGWTWRMNPASITFAEVTIEVCDATPSYVQNNCPSFPNGQYCPWSAELIALGDCRTDPSCPAVPR